MVHFPTKLLLLSSNFTLGYMKRNVLKDQFLTTFFCFPFCNLIPSLHFFWGGEAEAADEATKRKKMCFQQADP